MFISIFSNARIKSVSILLFISLQITACGSENSGAASSRASDKGITQSTEKKDKINTPAVITGDNTGSVTEDINADIYGLLSTAGKLDITDKDSNEAAFNSAVTHYSNYGSLDIEANGYWAYRASNTLDAIQSLTSQDTLIDSITISSLDGTSHNIVITIFGADEPEIIVAKQPAIISGTDIGSVTEDNDSDGDGLLSSTGKLTITDNNPGEASFIAATITGNYGNLLIDTTGDWVYFSDNSQSAIQNLSNGNTLTDNITIKSYDGTSHAIVITIQGTDEANQSAIITGTDRKSVTEDDDPNNNGLLETTGKLSITDADAGEASFIAKNITGNYGNLTISSDGNWNYMANNNQSAIQDLTNSDSLTDTYTVSSFDGTAHTIIITINGVDEITNTAADIVLLWIAPAAREDNQAIALSDIAGYKIYYGNSPGGYNGSVSINNRAIESYTFTQLPVGTYYFAITTLDTDGRESQYSTEVAIEI